MLSVHTYCAYTNTSKPLLIFRHTHTHARKQFCPVVTLQSVLVYVVPLFLQRCAAVAEQKDIMVAYMTKVSQNPGQVMYTFFYIGPHLICIAYANLCSLAVCILVVCDDDVCCLVSH